MNILVASDSFKDALPALEVCKAIKRGILKSKSDFHVKLFPLGDGGEGTAEVLTWHSKGRWLKTKVHDPLLRQIEAGFGISENGKTAYIEMAQASGIQLLNQAERNCLKTSTFGTGELILAAVNTGAREIVLGIGGSATNDLGIGMAAALGFQFFNEEGIIVLPVGEQLRNIVSINSQNVVDLSGIDFKILCDVDNPLFGPHGAANTYGSQKGADELAIKQLDDGARHFSTIIKKHFNKYIADQKGAGAAGGLGAGAMVFLDGKLHSGIDYVLNATRFDECLKGVDLVITGEGKIDEQTLHGKLIRGICKHAKQFGIPVLAFCGVLTATQDQVRKMGLKNAISINPPGIGVEESISKTEVNLEMTASKFINYL